MHLKQVTLLSNTYPTRDHYPFCLPLFQQTERIVFDSPVTIFCGENGTGKSTLLEAITNRCGIHIWRDEGRVRYHDNPYEKRLQNHIAIEWTKHKVPGAYFGSDTFHYFTEAVEGWSEADPSVLGYFGGESLVTQSHGQSMMAYFQSRYRIEGLYLLDEPETALSPRNQVRLANLLFETSQSGTAQFILATHSPILMACPGATILSFDDSPIAKVAYEETAYYQLFKAFMADPAEYLRQARETAPKSRG